jgi:hypothetical protein
MNNIDKFLKNKQIINSENIFYFSVVWSVLSLLFFLLYGVPDPEQELPSWYAIGTYISSMIPFLIAAILCARNWLAPHILSGKKVWLLMGIGMISYFLGDVFLGTWEVILGLEADISPADIFYYSFYIFVGWGILLTVLHRRLNLSLTQWLIIAGVVLFGILLAVWITVLIPQNLADVAETATKTTSEVAEQAKGLDGFLSRFSDIFNFFYLVCDLTLLVLASMLLLAFWEGKFSQPWKIIAAAIIALYIADMWFQYSLVTDSRFATANLLEVCFVFSGVLFALGAAREYDLSLTRGRINRRRR